MRHLIHSIRDRFDQAGILLSGMCAVHCVAVLVLVSLLGIGGGVLADPEIHHYGLAAALVIGLIGLGFGVMRHGQTGPLVTGGAGLALMAIGLAVPHGVAEAIFSISGVSLLAFAHWRNMRHIHTQTACGCVFSPSEENADCLSEANIAVPGRL